MKRGEFFACVDEAAAWIAERTDVRPKVAVVLSAGLGGVTESIDGPKNFVSADIPHFPKARAEGHRGSLSFGTLEGTPIVAMSGRLHHYEGHAPHEIVFPYFLFEKLGASCLILTNAVGGVNKRFRPGDLMLVTDHINMMGINPLVGISIERPQEQFINLIGAYDEGLREVAKRVAGRVGVKLREGVYMATSGPSYETVAEVAAYRKMGADAVGMSTIPEVIAARFLGMRVMALSCIANPAADLHGGEMSHAEVLEAMEALAPKAVALIRGVIGEMGKLK